MDKDYSRATEKIKRKKISILFDYFFNVSFTIKNSGMEIRKNIAPPIKIYGRSNVTEINPPTIPPIICGIVNVMLKIP